MSKILQVAIGIVTNKSQNTVLVTKRREGKHLAGFWEFPGGKIRKAESKFNALKREMFEEVGVTIRAASILMVKEHKYLNFTVNLTSFIVTSFEGEAFSKEGQIIKYIPIKDLTKIRIPDANRDIVQSIRLA